VDTQVTLMHGSAAGASEKTGFLGIPDGNVISGYYFLAEHLMGIVPTGKNGRCDFQMGFQKSAVFLVTAKMLAVTTQKIAFFKSACGTRGTTGEIPQ